MDVVRIMPGMGVRSNVGTMGAAGVTLINDDVRVLVDTGHYGTRDWLKADSRNEFILVLDSSFIVYFEVTSSTKSTFRFLSR